MQEVHLGGDLEILYKTENLEIKSYDFIEQHHHKINHMVDFFVVYNGVEYSCSAFSPQGVANEMNKHGYYWCISSIVIQELTKENLINAVLDIVNDKVLSLDDIFVRSY